MRWDALSKQFATSDQIFKMPSRCRHANQNDKKDATIVFVAE